MSQEPAFSSAHASEDKENQQPQEKKPFDAAQGKSVNPVRSQTPEASADLALPNRTSNGVKIGKIIVDRNLCIGAASCIAVAPGVFELDSENKAVVYNAKGADDETILLAAKSCPTQAILVFDEEGNQIYP